MQIPTTQRLRICAYADTLSAARVDQGFARGFTCIRGLESGDGKSASEVQRQAMMASPEAGDLKTARRGSTQEESQSKMIFCF